MSLFCCPLCAAPLEREAGVCRCPKGHSFDLAREGYVHLLPPNRKHSALPGDDRTWCWPGGSSCPQGIINRY